MYKLRIKTICYGLTYPEFRKDSQHCYYLYGNHGTALFCCYFTIFSFSSQLHQIFILTFIFPDVRVNVQILKYANNSLSKINDLE